MKSLILGLLLLPITITAVQLESTVAVAQGQAAQDYQKGREAFLSFTPQGFKSAISFYNKALKADPNYAPAYAGLGELYSFQGFYRYEVKEDYEQYYIDSYENMKKALKINPNLESVQLALAYTYLHLSDEREAISTVQKILSKNPNNFEALFILWTAKGSKPNNPKIKKVLELNPNYVPALVGLGTAYYQKRRSFSQAANYYSRAAEIAPSPQLYNYLGTALTYQGHYTQAINKFQKAIELDPKFASAYRNMGITYYHMGRSQDTIIAEQRAIALNPNSPEAFFFIAQSYDRGNNRQQAISYYNQFLNLVLGQDQYKSYASTAKQRIAALGGK